MGKANKTVNPKRNGKVKTFLRRLGIVTLLLLGCIGSLALVIWLLYVISQYLNPAISDPAQFITANLLNALIFAAIVAQVFIYRKQWRVMERQWSVALQGIRPIVEVRAVFQPNGDMNFVLSNIGRIPANVRFRYTCTLGVDRVIGTGTIEAEVGHNQREHTVKTVALRREIDDDIIPKRTPLRIEIEGVYEWEFGSYPIKYCGQYDPTSRLFSLPC